MNYRTREFIKYISKCVLGCLAMFAVMILAFMLNADRIEQSEEWEDSRIAQQVEHIELYE